MTDGSLYTVEAIAVMTLVVAGALVGLYRLMKSTRPTLAIGVPTAATVAVHFAAVAGVSTLGNARSLRGGDELGFLSHARQIASTGFFSTDFQHALTSNLHEWVFAVQLKLADMPESAMRVTQVGIAAVGVMLIATAVHDLAGPRAGRIAAWVVGLEPAGLFFSGLLHKEALMVLASGLVVLGAAKVWRDLRLDGLFLMAPGCLVALATRPYVGWFLVATSAAVLLHAGIRHLPGLTSRATAVLLVTVVAIGAAVPAVLQASSRKGLAPLQHSQVANATQGQGNLPLEQVDFSTRSKIVTNLPKRVMDLTFRPYVWQVDNTSQQLGVIGSIVALLALGLLIHTLVTARRHIFERAAPLLYPLIFLTIAYSLSAGNAGTSFRYRTHLVALALAGIVAVRLRAEPAEATEPAVAGVPATRPAGAPLGSLG